MEIRAFLGKFKNFEFKRWTLVAIFSVVILEKIITLISFLAKKNDYVKEIQLNEDVTLSKTQALIIVVISELITIAILIMGLIGALRQKFCLSLTFCIFFGLSMIKSVVDLSVGDQNIFIFIGLLIFFILDALFVYELRKLRSKRKNSDDDDDDSTKTTISTKLKKSSRSSFKNLSSKRKIEQSDKSDKTEKSDKTDKSFV